MKDVETIAQDDNHKPLHDPWMIDPSDPDYLEPMKRWCIKCGLEDFHQNHIV